MVDSIEKCGALAGLNVIGLRIDPSAWSPDCLLFAAGNLSSEAGHSLLKLIHGRKVVGCLASPPYKRGKTCPFEEARGSPAIAEP